MAEEIVVRIGINGFIGKALALANHEYLSKLESGNDLKERLQCLVEKLESLHALLPYAEKKAESSIAALDWLKRVVAIALKAEDLLGQCAYDVVRVKVESRDNEHNKVRNFFSLSNPRLLTSKITRSIALITSWIESVFRKGNVIGLASSQSVDMIAIVEDTKVSVDKLESPFWGPDDVESIIELLKHTANDEHLCVVSIVGVGGLGKTMLAWQTYEDSYVSEEFNERLWVCVSEDFEADRILKLMLQSLTRSSCEQYSREAILYELSKRLKGTKYLLILDNVWSTDLSKWSSLKDSLLSLHGSNGSKIIVTTRTQAVASLMSSDRRYIYFPRLQEEEKCWSMFAEIAFAEDGASVTPELEEIGRRIAKKCAGLPLAVKLIASLMHSKKKKREWSMIDDATSNLRFCTDNIIISLMKFCYHHLPSLAVKQCFAYCSIFPKDSIMEREELVQLWMAQGYLTPPKGSQLTMEEDVGARYLDILLRRSFLQDAHEDSKDDSKTLCKMHDALHDLALLLTKQYCSILRNENVKDDFGATHVSLIKCKVEMSRTLRERFALLRTLRLVDTRNLGDLLAYTTSLRVLIVVDLLLEELPSSIGKLKHLRYLDISRTRIVRFPDSITNLYNLQSLRLYDFDVLPKNFEDLVSLRHLHVENLKDLGKRSMLPPKFQELINPPSFKACLGRDCPFDMLKLEKPDRYSSLKICGLENVKESKKATLSKLSKMDTLKLHWTAGRENSNDENVLEDLEPHPCLRNLTIENFKGSNFPSWIGKREKLCNLVKIELEGCRGCKKIPPLGHLQSLKILRIVGMDSVTDIGADFYGFEDHISYSVGNALFPVLEEFSLKHMANLGLFKSSHQSLRAFPHLEKLEVEQCPKLTHLPDSLIRACEKVGRLEITFCNKLAPLLEVIGKLQRLEDLELRGLPSIHENLIGEPYLLKSLTIGSCFSASEDNANSKSLPDKVGKLINLRNLTIWGYDKMEDLPEWLGELKSLQVLKLELCQKLKSLPSSDALQKLRDLVELNICLCPLLEERCIRGRPEWPKISHIPTIKITYETIQSPQ